MQPVLAILGARLGISAARIIVLSVSAGSVQVGLRIFDPEGLAAEATAADSASFLMTQLAASSNPLLLQQGYVVIDARRCQRRRRHLC